jgi:hypothetical protein
VTQIVATGDSHCEQIFEGGFGHEDLNPMDRYQQSMTVKHEDVGLGHGLRRRSNLGFVKHFWQLSTRQSTTLVLAVMEKDKYFEDYAESLTERQVVTLPGDIRARSHMLIVV